MVQPAFSPPRSTGAPAVAPMLSVRSMPAVAVTIDGKGPYTFGIDTGADGYVHIAEPLAQHLGLAVVGKDITADPTGKNPIPILRYRVGAFVLAGVTFHDIIGDGLPAIAGHALPFDGVIGMDLFDAFTLTLDFKRREVALSTEPAPAADGVSIFTYQPGPTMRLPVTIGAATYEADLDTGNMGAPLIFPAEWIARLPTNGPPKLRGEAHSVSQTVKIYSVPIDAAVRVGGVALPATEVDYPNVASVANIGSKALQSMTVRIDRVNHRVQLIA